MHWKQTFVLLSKMSAFIGTILTWRTSEYFHLFTDLIYFDVERERSLIFTVITKHSIKHHSAIVVSNWKETNNFEYFFFKYERKPEYHFLKVSTVVIILLGWLFSLVQLQSYRRLWNDAKWHKYLSKSLQEQILQQKDNMWKLWSCTEVPIHLTDY